MKNILVLTGSPRKGGNSDLLADAFIKGARSKGHAVYKFETAFEQIQGCKACDACWTGDSACIYRDGFAKLEPLLEKADCIVFASPLYWFGMSSQLKSAIDRLYAYVRDACKRPLAIKECVLLACGGDTGDGIFDGMIGTYQGIANYMEWTDKGILSVPDVYDIGDIERTGALQKAEDLGKSI